MTIFLMMNALISLSGAIEGTFSYKGELQALSAVRYEMVSPLSAAGQGRITELKNLGYSCQNKLQFVQCRKHIEASQLPEELNQAEPSATTVQFGPLISLDLISQGDEIAFFEGTQDVWVDGKFYDTVNYLERPDLVKATVGHPKDSSNYYSFIVNTNDVSMVETLNLTESKWAYTSYFVEFILSR